MDSLQRRTQSVVNHLVSVNTSAESSQVVNAEVDALSGVGVIILNSPPVNAINEKLMKGLDQALQDCLKTPSVRAIVLTGERVFSGGADIIQFKQKNPAETEKILDFANKLCSDMENATKPIVAAIDGFALGGGLELAMACHARICTPSSSLGLPELTLGLIPGFGGTQRLPRLVGTQKACEMMLTSTSVGAQEAKEFCLVDDIVNGSELINAATKMASELARKGSSAWRRTLELNDKIEVELSKQIIGMARKQIARMDKVVPHPSAALNSIEAGILHGPMAGLDKEFDEFMRVVHAPTANALIHVFFSKGNTKKVPGVTDRGLKARSINNAAVIGGGTMGSGIVTAFILSGIRTVLKEVNQNFLDAGVSRVKDNLKRRLSAGKLSESDHQKALNLLVPQLDFKGFEQLELVVEAVLEQVPLKQQIFQELEAHCNSDCILASNTSTINLDLVGQRTSAQHRIIGMHFFSPAHVMPLLEIVRTNSTSQQTIIDVLGVASRLKKIPIVVGNCVGFTVNRIFFPYLQVALFLLERGVSVERIDRALENFGFAVGPFKMADMSGIDVFGYVGNIISENYSDRVYKSTLIGHMLKAGRLGQKNGKGFYKYEGRKAVPDPELTQFIESARKDAGSPANVDVSDAEIAQILLYPVINECCRVLVEGMVVRPDDIDIGSIYGYNFPAFRGGAMKWAKMEGHHRIALKLQEYHNKFKSNIFAPAKELFKLEEPRKV